jgi:hypothetical protein
VLAVDEPGAGEARRLIRLVVRGVATWVMPIGCVGLRGVAALGGAKGEASPWVGLGALERMRAQSRGETRQVVGS